MPILEIAILQQIALWINCGVAAFHVCCLLRWVTWTKRFNNALVISVWFATAVICNCLSLGLALLGYGTASGLLLAGCYGCSLGACHYFVYTCVDITRADTLRSQNSLHPRSSLLYWPFIGFSFLWYSAFVGSGLAYQKDVYMRCFWIGGVVTTLSGTAICMIVGLRLWRRMRRANDPTYKRTLYLMACLSLLLTCASGPALLLAIYPNLFELSATAWWVTWCFLTAAPSLESILVNGWFIARVWSGDFSADKRATRTGGSEQSSSSLPVAAS